MRRIRTRMRVAYDSTKQCPIIKGFSPRPLRTLCVSALKWFFQRRDAEYTERPQR
jgi:hypothetical protein